MKVPLRDVRRIVKDNPSASLEWRVNWTAGWYGGETRRWYQASLGASEIVRCMANERRDHRGVGHIIQTESFGVEEFV